MSDFSKLAKDFKENWQIVLAIVYVAGFAVWNRFLSNFGFFEYDFLQTKFISAGIWTTLSFYLLYIWKLRKRNTAAVGISFSVYVFVIFPVAIFPLIPSSMGGGMPIVTSLIDASEEILHLQNNFNIPAAKNGTNPPVQTEPLCLFFARENLLIIGPIYTNIGRIIVLPRDRGFSQSIGGFSGRGLCYEYIWPWLFRFVGPIARWY